MYELYFLEGMDIFVEIKTFHGFWKKKVLLCKVRLQASIDNQLISLWLHCFSICVTNFLTLGTVFAVFGMRRSLEGAQNRQCTGFASKKECLFLVESRAFQCI